MSGGAIVGIVFACLFGGALLGLFLGFILPESHRSSETKDVMRLGMGLLATMTALVLSLLIASTKNSYDTKRSELIQMAANVALLDRGLALYGPETNEARDLLRRSVARALDQMWPPSGTQPADLNPAATGAEALYERIHALSPQSEAQRSLRAEALKIATDLGRMRSLLFAQTGSAIPLPFLVILVFWLTVIFVSYGLLAQAHTTVVTTLFVWALSVSGAIFLILELDQPFQGLFRLSDAPIRSALANLGR